MKLTHLFGVLTLFLFLTNTAATEITTCVVDSSLKTNPRVYFFPISSTHLRCDHITDNTSVTLSELYEENWRLLQVINPIEFKQKDSGAGYTPVLLYLERTIRPAKPKQKYAPAESSSSSNDVDIDSTSEETSSAKSGGIFGNWFKGETQEETESE